MFYQGSTIPGNGEYLPRIWDKGNKMRENREQTQGNVLSSGLGQLDQNTALVSMAESALEPLPKNLALATRRQLEMLEAGIRSKMVVRLFEHGSGLCNPLDHTGWEAGEVARAREKDRSKQFCEVHKTSSMKEYQDLGEGREELEAPGPNIKKV